MATAKKAGPSPIRSTKATSSGRGGGVTGSSKPSAVKSHGSDRTTTKTLTKKQHMAAYKKKVKIKGTAANRSFTKYGGKSPTSSQRRNRRTLANRGRRKQPGQTGYVKSGGRGSVKKFGIGGKLSATLRKLREKYKGRNLPSKPKSGKKVPRGKFIGSRGRSSISDLKLLKKKFGASRKRYATQGNRELAALKLEKSKRGRPAKK